MLMRLHDRSGKRDEAFVTTLWCMFGDVEPRKYHPTPEGYYARALSWWFMAHTRALHLCQRDILSQHVSVCLCLSLSVYVCLSLPPSVPPSVSPVSFSVPLCLLLSPSVSHSVSHSQHCCRRADIAFVFTAMCEFKAIDLNRCKGTTRESRSEPE